MKFYEGKVRQAGDKHAADGLADLTASISECRAAATEAYEQSLTLYGESLRQFSASTSSSSSYQITRRSVGGLALDIVTDMKNVDATNPERDVGMSDFVLEKIINPALALSETLDDVLKLLSCLEDTSPPEFRRRIDEKIEMKVRACGSRGQYCSSL